MSYPDYSPDEIPVDRSVRVTHLVFGLFFLGAAAVWALVMADVITADRLAILGPAVLIGAGVIGLAASLANSRNRRRRHQVPTSTTQDGYDDTTYETTDETTDDTQEIR